MNSWKCLFVVIILHNLKNSFYIYSSVISYIESLIETIIIFMVILRKDNRGLHDMISGTKVIEESKE